MRNMPLYRFALVVALLLAAPLGPVHAQGTDADAAAVASAVRDFHAALEAGDAQTVSRLLAPDAAILEGGDRETRKEYLDHHLQADIKFAQAVPARHSNIDVTMSGEVAWAISTSVTQGTYESKPVNLAGAELMVLSKTPAGWVIRSIHWSSRKSR
jgi:ketosteroid isomerase-like protein